MVAAGKMRVTKLNASEFRDEELVHVLCMKSFQRHNGSSLLGRYWFIIRCFCSFQFAEKPSVACQRFSIKSVRIYYIFSSFTTSNCLLKAPVISIVFPGRISPGRLRYDNNFCNMRVEKGCPALQIKLNISMTLVCFLQSLCIILNDSLCMRTTIRRCFLSPSLSNRVDFFGTEPLIFNI